MLTSFARSLSLAALAFGTSAAILGAQDTKPKTPKPVSWVCKDGTTSTVAGSGACSGHKGVDSAASKAAKDAAKADKAEAKAAKAKMNKSPEKAAKEQAKADAAKAKADKAEDKAAKDSTGATARCTDGTYSHAKTLLGACSRHGGVAKTLKPKP